MDARHICMNVRRGQTACLHRHFPKSSVHLSCMVYVSRSRIRRKARVFEYVTAPILHGTYLWAWMLGMVVVIGWSLTMEFLQKFLRSALDHQSY